LIQKERGSEDGIVKGDFLKFLYAAKLNHAVMMIDEASEEWKPSSHDTQTSQYLYQHIQTTIKEATPEQLKKAFNPAMVHKSDMDDPFSNQGFFLKWWLVHHGLRDRSLREKIFKENMRVEEMYDLLEEVRAFRPVAKDLRKKFRRVKSKWLSVVYDLHKLNDFMSVNSDGVSTPLWPNVAEFIFVDVVEPMEEIWRLCSSDDRLRKDFVNCSGGSSLTLPQKHKEYIQTVNNKSKDNGLSHDDFEEIFFAFKLWQAITQQEHYGQPGEQHTAAVKWEELSPPVRRGLKRMMMLRNLGNDMFFKRLFPDGLDLDGMHRYLLKRKAYRADGDEMSEIGEKARWVPMEENSEAPDEAEEMTRKARKAILPLHPDTFADKMTYMLTFLFVGGLAYYFCVHRRERRREGLDQRFELHNMSFQ